MNGQQIVIQARQLCTCDATQIPDNDTATQLGMLTYLNIAYSQVISRLNEVGSDNYSEIATTDLGSGQTEYNLPVKTSTVPGFDTLLAVSINYNLGGVTNWTRLRSERQTNLTYDEVWYTTNQPFTDPFYIVYDTGIRIFPNANQSVTGGLKMFYGKIPPDLAISSGSTPVIDPKWHTIIAYCMAPLMWEALGNPDRASQARQQFEIEIERAVDNSNLTEISPFEREEPLLTQFQ